jgi:DNA modification methylase
MAIIKQEYIGGQRLILGDCREIIGGLTYDAICTDPPYGIGRDGKPQSSSKHGGHKGYAFKGWDSEPPTDAFIASIAYAPNGSIIWGANYYPAALKASSRWLVWDKGQRIDQADAELAYCSTGGALRVFTLNRVALMQDGAVHPTQKPLALIEWCIGFLPDARTILDPFAGSGTLAVAAYRTGRQSICIERDPEYFAIACRRVDEAARQPDLLISPPQPKPEQKALDL